MSSQEWGNITWKFFHTLADKIDESQFYIVKDRVIDIIVSTCGNLPCPDCSEHATKILKKSYIRNIRTKEHLIEFIRQLHNIINIKLSKKTYSSEEIKDMYINVNIYATVKELIHIYSKKTSAPKMMSHNLHKNIFMRTLTSKLNNIKHAII